MHREDWACRGGKPNPYLCFICREQAECIRDKAHEVADRLNQYLKALADYEIKLEKFCDSILFTGVKKRYITKSGEEYSIKGFEHARRDAAEIAKRVQMEVLKRILNGNTNNVVDYLRNIITNYEIYLLIK